MTCMHACMPAHAGVYFEKYVKGKQGQTLWIRNLQLSIYGVPLSMAYAYLRAGRCAHAERVSCCMVLAAPDAWPKGGSACLVVVQPCMRILGRVRCQGKMGDAGCLRLTCTAAQDGGLRRHDAGLQLARLGRGRSAGARP